MKFLTINGKVQTLGGKPIIVPDDYDDNLIKIGEKLVKIGTNLIGSKHNGDSGGESTVTAGATFLKDGVTTFLTWNELKDPANGTTYGYRANLIADETIMGILGESMEDSIETSAFAGCNNIVSITLPSTITQIQSTAFMLCSNLNKFKYQGTSQQWRGIDKQIVWSAMSNFHTVECQDRTINLGKLSAPLFEQAFGMREADFDIISLSANVSFIQNNSIIGVFGDNGDAQLFGNPSLEAIQVPDFIETLGSKSFKNFTTLNELWLPNSLQSIESEALCGCIALKDITFDGTKAEWNSITKADNWNAESSISTIHCTDGDVVISTVTSISIKTMPNKTIYYDYETFDKTGLVLTATWSDGSTTEVTDDKITVVSKELSLSTTSVQIKYAGKICDVPITVNKSVSSLAIKTMPNKTIYRANETFDKTGLVLTATWIDGSIEEITDDKIIVVNGNISKDTEYVQVKYENKTCNVAINVIVSFSLSSSNYTQAGITREGNVVIPETFEYDGKIYEVTSIAQNAFTNCTDLISISIPDSVKSIGSSAFKDCTNLTSITIPNSVTSIDVWTFYGCTSLTSITIPDSVESIGNAAFRDCASLTSITIPDSVTSIGDYAFRDCTSLASVTISNSVTSIGMDTFHGCTSLTSITIPDSVESIGNGAFQGCTSLANVTIPDSVTSIEAGAFRDCASLTSITIPNAVTSIHSYTFSHCTSLASVTIPNTVTSISERAFEQCTSLKSITFNGTFDKWYRIKKGYHWNYNAPYRVHCTDKCSNPQDVVIDCPIHGNTGTGSAS